MEMPGVDRFTMFGCWNNGVCDVGNPASNGMSAVFSSLMHSHFDPSFYIVAGDNYYPTTVRLDGGTKKKKKKRKSLDVAALTSGFTCLVNLSEKENGAPVYLLMGNHDLQEEPDFGENRECDIIKLELDSSRGTAIDTKTTVMLRGDTVFVFLDTNLYEGGSDVKYARCELIYRDKIPELGHLSKSAIIHQITEEVERDIADSIGAIRDSGAVINNVFVVGHHPILGCKGKVDEETGEIKCKAQRIDDRGAGFIAREIYASFPEAAQYYLCADIHQFQVGEVRIEGLDRAILQYIVGTGGASLDELVPQIGATIRNGPLEYTCSEGKSVNGYLNVTRKGVEYDLRFVEVGEESRVSPLSDRESRSPSESLRPESPPRSTAKGVRRRRKSRRKTQKKKTQRKAWRRRRRRRTRSRKGVGRHSMARRRSRRR